MFSRILTIAITIVLGFISINAQTLDEIIEKTLKSRGNVALAENLKSIVLTGNQTMTGMSVAFTYKMKDNEMYFFESEAMGQKQILGIDHDTAWQNTGGVTQFIPKEYIEQVISQINQFENFVRGPFLKKEKKDKFEYSGIVTEDERESYTIKLIQEGEERESYLYIDKNNYELFKLWAQTQDEQGNTVDIELRLKDYKDVSGFKYPHLVEMVMGDYGTQVITFEKIEVNSPIDDSIFKAPKTEEAPKTE
jgi:outer membrane lipoprotein-sorting protein